MRKGFENVSSYLLPEQKTKRGRTIQIRRNAIRDLEIVENNCREGAAYFLD